MELVKHEDTVTEIERTLITSIRRVDGEYEGEKEIELVISCIHFREI